MAKRKYGLCKKKKKCMPKGHEKKWTSVQRNKTMGTPMPAEKKMDKCLKE
jgi:hypothetical protein